MRLANELLDPDMPSGDDAAGVVESVHFVFRLGELVYALPPGVVELVAPEQRSVPVPTAPTFVRGAVYVRGRVAAVVDLAAVLGLDARPEPADAAERARRRLVLASALGVTFAFVADETLGLWIRAGQPARAEAADRPVVGRFEEGGVAVAVLDPLALVRLIAADAVADEAAATAAATPATEVRS